MANLDLSGRTCLVTGASSGIGEATALDLARKGGRVVMVCRSRERGEAARKRIVEDSGNDAVELRLADLAQQAEIRRLAEEIRADHPAIHLLVNNAGLVNLRRETTPDGLEAMFAVNHLAYFLLTRLLLDAVLAAAPARIVNVASEGHRFGRLDFDDLNAERSYRMMRVYGTSKLANILFTAELARRLEGTGVTVNSLHPGAVATGLGKNNGAFSRFATALLRPFFRTPAQGAETSIHVATAPELEGVTGRYFEKCREKRTSAAARDPELAARLWEVSCELTGLPNEEDT